LRKAVIQKVRSGELAVPEGSAADVIARHREADGRLLDEKVAAVELLNLLRPIVAIARFGSLPWGSGRNPAHRPVRRCRGSARHRRPFVQKSKHELLPSDAKQAVEGPTACLGERVQYYHLHLPAGPAKDRRQFLIRNLQYLPVVPQHLKAQVQVHLGLFSEAEDRQELLFNCGGVCVRLYPIAVGPPLKMRSHPR
jgi:hypothetical protein